MEQIVHPARKIIGESLVPGELRPAEQALILAVMADGESCISNVPPAIDRLAGILGEIGAQIFRNGRELMVRGSGLRGFRPATSLLDLTGMEETALMLLSLLAGQPFASRIKMDSGCASLRELLPLLASMGAVTRQETTHVFLVGGTGNLKGTAHDVVDVDPATKLAVLVAGLYSEGSTSLRESAANRNRVERILRERQITVDRRRLEQGNQYLVSIQGEQAVRAFDAEIPGDLSLAYPLMIAALCRRGSTLKIRQVAIRSGQRAFLDIVRQIGGEIEIQDLEDEVADLSISFSRQLKPTRVAGQRVEKVIEHIALLAILATQTPGEFVIRDLAHLRRGAFDYVSLLFELLKQIGARVGEYPEGIVVKGGSPLRGARIDTRGDPGLAMAFAVAGLLAESEMVISDAECLDGIYPDFFATLDVLRERRR